MTVKISAAGELDRFSLLISFLPIEILTSKARTTTAGCGKRLDYRGKIL